LIVPDRRKDLEVQGVEPCIWGVWHRGCQLEDSFQSILWLMTTGLDVTKHCCGINELPRGFLDEIVDIRLGRPGL
jgi:hypothetical protein